MTGWARQTALSLLMVVDGCAPDSGPRLQPAAALGTSGGHAPGAHERLETYAPWSMLGGTARRAFLGLVDGPHSPSVRFSTPLGARLWASPVVAIGEVVFGGLVDGTLVRLSAEGTVTWSASVGTDGPGG